MRIVILLFIVFLFLLSKKIRLFIFYTFYLLFLIISNLIYIVFKYAKKTLPYLLKKIQKLFYRILFNNYVTEKKLIIVKEYANHQFSSILNGTLSDYHLENYIIPNGKFNSISLDFEQFSKALLKWYCNEYLKFDKAYSEKHNCEPKFTGFDILQEVALTMTTKTPSSFFVSLGLKYIPSIYFNIKRKFNHSKIQKNIDSEFKKLLYHYYFELNNHVFKDYNTYIDDIYFYLTDFCTKTIEYFKKCTD